MSGARTPGVYLAGDATGTPVHEYLDDDYELADVVEVLGIGSMDDETGVVTLTAHERRLLRVTADARSFDHAPEFIRMCLDIAAVEPADQGTDVRLRSVG